MPTVPPKEKRMTNLLKLIRSNYNKSHASKISYKAVVVVMQLICFFVAAVVVVQVPIGFIVSGWVGYRLYEWVWGWPWEPVSKQDEIEDAEWLLRDEGYIVLSADEFAKALRYGTGPVSAE